MSCIFIISSIFALGAAYLYYSVSEEIPRIMAFSMVAICFFLDMVVAPWQIQLLILITVLVTTRNISLPQKRHL